MKTDDHESEFSVLVPIEENTIMTANKTESKPIETINLKKIIAITLAAYVLLAVLFFFLCGEQLKLRDSRGNTEMLVANSATVELAAGTVIEQQFCASIQRLDTISLLWGSYYRANSGTISSSTNWPQDFKAKYKRSVLGVLWSFLTAPIFVMSQKESICTKRPT